MSDIKALLLEAACYMQRSDPEFAAKLEAAAEAIGEAVAWVPAELIRRECTGAMAFWEMNREDQVPVYLAPQPAVPEWKDPYTNNGDSTSVTDYRHGWNACRDAMLATTEDV